MAGGGVTLPSTSNVRVLRSPAGNFSLCRSVVRNYVKFLVRLLANWLSRCPASRLFRIDLETREQRAEGRTPGVPMDKEPSPRAQRTLPTKSSRHQQPMKSPRHQPPPTKSPRYMQPTKSPRQIQAAKSQRQSQPGKSTRQPQPGKSPRQPQSGKSPRQAPPTKSPRQPSKGSPRPRADTWGCDLPGYVKAGVG